MRSQQDVAAMQCPVCRVPLAMSDRQGIEIDYCPQCRGVWLDRGELDKIVERSVPEMAPAPVQQPAPTPRESRDYDRGAYRDDNEGHGRGAFGGFGMGGGYGHGHGKPHKRRKSFLEELFD